MLGAMRRIFFVLLALAGCGTPTPREEEALLTDARERIDRDVLAVRLTETDDGTRTSVVVPRTGDVEFRYERGTKRKGGVNDLMLQGFGPRRQRERVSVTSEQRDAVVARFAALPQGNSDWTLPLVEPEPPKPRVPGCGPETEVYRTPVTIRLVLVSATGDLQKTVTIYRGMPAGTCPSASPGGEAVWALEKSFQALCVPPDRVKEK